MEKSENYWGDLCKLHEVIFDLVMSDNTLKMKKIMPSFCKGMKSVIIFKKKYSCLTTRKQVKITRV